MACCMAMIGGCEIEFSECYVFGDLDFSALTVKHWLISVGVNKTQQKHRLVFKIVGAFRLASDLRLSTS